MPPPAKSALYRARYRLCSVLLAVFAVALAGAGCTPDEPDFEVTIDEDAMPLSFDIIGQGAQARFADTTRLALRDSAAWTALQAQLPTPAPMRPVDFSQMMVVVVAVPTPTGGYGVEIESVDETAQGLAVGYLLTAPADDCVTPMGRATPFQAVRVRRAEGAVRFEQRTETIRCSIN